MKAFHPLFLKFNFMEYTLAAIRDGIIKQMKPDANNDIDISEEWIEDAIDMARASLVRKLVNSNDDFSGWYQTVSLESEMKKSILIDGYNYELKNPISVITLPGELMQGMKWRNVIHFGQLGFEQLNYGRVSMREFQEYKFHRFGNNSPIYFVDGDKIYIRGNGLHRYFTVTAIFAKPTCVPDYSIDQSIYPLPVSLLLNLEIIVFQHLGPKVSLPVDSVPDGLDGTRIGSMNNALRESQREQG